MVNRNVPSGCVFLLSSNSTNDSSLPFRKTLQSMTSPSISNSSSKFNLEHSHWLGCTHLQPDNAISSVTQSRQTKQTILDCILYVLRKGLCALLVPSFRSLSLVRKQAVDGERQHINVTVTSRSRTKRNTHQKRPGASSQPTNTIQCIRVCILFCISTTGVFPASVHKILTSLDEFSIFVGATLTLGNERR